MHGYLARAAEKQPTLLVIEDLHWASATTRLAIQHLARFAGRAPLLLVVTTRASAPDLDDRLAEFLSDLGRSPSVEMVRLAGLDRADVAELLDGLGSECDPEQATIDAGGNPLFVRELAEGSHPRRIGAGVAVSSGLAALGGRGRDRRRRDGDRRLVRGRSRRRRDEARTSRRFWTGWRRQKAPD